MSFYDCAGKEIFSRLVHCGMLRKFLFGAVALLFGAVGFLAVAGFFGYFLLFPPVPPPPEIGRGLDGNVVVAAAEFKRRVAEQYPLPISEGELATLLGQQGFEVAGDRKDASFTSWNYVCKEIWTVSWSADAGEVTGVEGFYGRWCL
ncbi:hypothetical protein [uncultured Roseibium sp.]|uniref:hypothetical protein n=1 Tax=uncultured Roseibium sp. TaxID=1936171 RepID=UPI0032161F91